MIAINRKLTPHDLKAKLETFWEVSADKIETLQKAFDPARGAPVFTVNGVYTLRGWTDWTQGFLFGSSLLQFDATGDETILEKGKAGTLQYMGQHVSHFGVHDHGFNNISTYGNLLRLMNEKRIPENADERSFYKLALQVSGAVQARRWTPLPDDLGYVYSFNGPHSLFVDTLRSMRSLVVAHALGHSFSGEHDESVSLLERALQHARTTALYAVYYGKGRDHYDERGRVAHESIFNINDGFYRCPNTQQGYSPFTTWFRGLAWAMLGFAELLESLQIFPESDFDARGGRKAVEAWMLEAARAVCDFYIAHAAADGIPYWDSGAPLLHRLENALDKPADPWNAYEPVDSSSAAIATQALLRLGRYLTEHGEKETGAQYFQAGLTVIDTLLQPPYLDMTTTHQGLILHAVYHRPNGWDAVPRGQSVPCGESCMWGDYHAREAALYLLRIAEGLPCYTFYGCAHNNEQR